MAQEKLKTRLPLLTSDDLIRLAYDLRTIGFNIDTHHFIDAHRADDILLGLEVQGDLKGPERLKTILAPIFCSTPEEQTTFYNFFDSWLYRNSRISQKFKEADGRVEYQQGGSGSGNFFTRHKYRFIGLVSFVVLAVFVFWYFWDPHESKYNRLQGRVVDGKTEGPIEGVSVGYADRTAQTDSSGFFDLNEFQDKTTGDLTFTHQAYLTKTLSGKSTTTQQNIETFQLWRLLEDPRTVIIELKDRGSGEPVADAGVTFLEEVKRTDTSGKSSFNYRQKESTSQIEIKHDEYLKKTQPYQLHGYDNETVTVELEKNLTAEAVALQALVLKVNDVKLAPPDGAWKTFYKKHYREILIGSALLPFLILFGWLFGRWYRKPLILEREATTETPSVDYVTVEWLAEFLFKNPQLRRIIQQFRQHRESSEIELDTEATIHRTVNNGGMFTPAYRSRFVLPEYLVLIDRASFDDQQAKFVDELINRFTGDGVFMDRYYFKRDPRVCQPEKPAKPQIALKELITLHPNHRVLVFSDAEGFIDPLTGKLHTWIDTLLHWSSTGIFIPERTEGIRYLAMALGESGFHVEPVSTVGLARHIQNIQLDAETARFEWSVGSPYPLLFEERKDVWLQQAEPELSHIAELITEIQRYLDEESVYWLSACAVYPELHWELTLYLATKLKLGDKETLTGEEQDLLQKKLLELTRLPWFRYGGMPDWLRLRLIRLLQKKHQHHQIRRIMKELLSFARKDYRPGSQTPGGVIKLPVAWKRVIFHINYLKHKIAALFQKEPEESPLNDYVFSNYISGSERSLLGVIIPDRVKHLFFRKGQALLGLKPVVSFILAAAISALTFSACNWLQPKPEVIDPIPEFNFVKKASLAGFEEPAGVSEESLDVCISRFMAYRGIPVTTDAEETYRQIYPDYSRWLLDTLKQKAGLDTSQFAFYTGTSGDPDGGVIDLNDRLYLMKVISIVEGVETEKLTAAPLVYDVRKLEEDMVIIQGGCFDMGDTFGDGEDNEKPVHEVCVDDFSMGKYEVTQGQWQEIMGKNPSRFQQGDNYPVENVSWDEVQEFIKILNEKTGKNYRLPIEAEWEYAARGGGKEIKYAGTSNEEELYRYANFCDKNCENKRKTDSQNDGFRNTAPVGRYKPNGLGLYDMSGNVWEWCQDWYAGDYYKKSPVKNPEGPDTGSNRVTRGGSWNSYATRYCRSSYRNDYDPSYENSRLGFRLVLPQVISEGQREVETKQSPEALRGEGLKVQGKGEAQGEKPAAKSPVKETLKMEFVDIPSGEFFMGSPESDKVKDNDETPQHKVIIENGFSLQKTEVTQGQWMAVMGSNPSYFNECGDDCPVENVSWDEGQEFIRRLNEKTGMKYRLPTEAEWEYAARAGSTTRYPCGDDEGCLDDIAWYDANSGGKTHPVGQKQPNAWGLYDMSGNVWEWCRDWYASDYYKKSPVKNPEGPETGSARVFRGGCRGSNAGDCRSSYRFHHNPSYEDIALGFRLVLPQVISEGQREAETKRSPEALRDEGRTRQSGDEVFKQMK